MRWITIGPSDQAGTSILLGPPAADSGITEDERRTIVEMMAKGTYGWIIPGTTDLDGTFERIQASDVEVVQEPTEEPYGRCQLTPAAGDRGGITVGREHGSYRSVRVLAARAPKPLLP